MRVLLFMHQNLKTSGGTRGSGWTGKARVESRVARCPFQIEKLGALSIQTLTNQTIHY